MTNRTLRAAVTALLLGTATFAGVAVVGASPAMAALRQAVGKPLQESVALYNQGNYKAAMAKVQEAEAVSGKTAEETSTINKMKDAIAVASGDTNTAKGCQAKFAKDYNSGKYKEVIGDSDCLKKTGTQDGTNMTIIAQAYFQSGDKAGCVKYIKNNFASPAVKQLELLVRCAYDSQDEDTQRSALETLVAQTGKPDYWANLLKLSEQAQGMRDHDTLDIYRLKLLTGTINGPTAKADYFLLAQLALQLGFPSEAVSVLTKGQAAVKELNDGRTNKLLELAKANAASDAANIAKKIATDGAAPQGDALVKDGEDQIGMGNAKDAVATIQAGMKKPLADQNNAEMRLGMAYLYAGQKADAAKAFDSVKGPKGNNAAMIAHLWSLYARH